jgi:hypothetical protein
MLYWQWVSWIERLCRRKRAYYIRMVVISLCKLSNYNLTGVKQKVTRCALIVIITIEKKALRSVLWSLFMSKIRGYQPNDITWCHTEVRAGPHYNMLSYDVVHEGIVDVLKLMIDGSRCLEVDFSSSYVLSGMITLCKSRFREQYATSSNSN